MRQTTSRLCKYEINRVNSVYPFCLYSEEYDKLKKEKNQQQKEFAEQLKTLQSRFNQLQTDFENQKKVIASSTRKATDAQNKLEAVKSGIEEKQSQVDSLNEEISTVVE